MHHSENEGMAYSIRTIQELNWETYKRSLVEWAIQYDSFQYTKSPLTLVSDHALCPKQPDVFLLTTCFHVHFYCAIRFFIALHIRIQQT